MTNLYVRDHGMKVSRRGERLVVSKGGKVVDEVPLGQIEQVVLNGNSQITSQAMRSVIQRGGKVTHLFGSDVVDSTGMYSKSAELQLAQMRLFDDERFCLQLAQQIIIGKINNQRTILQRQAQRVTTSGFAVDQQLYRRGLSGMMEMLKSVSSARTLDSLRGYEGKAAAYYFEAVRSLLHPSWGFKKRDFYPAPDPFNALLSFSYTLVRKEVLAAAAQVGLNPYLGFFHVVASGRQALAIDMMEEWRPVVADAMALELVNRGTLTPRSFQRTSNPRRPVELGKERIKVVIEAFESRMATTHYHPLAAGRGGNTALRHALLLQMRQLAQVIQGKRKRFEPFKIK